MGNNLTLESLFTTPSVEIRLPEVIINLLCAALLAYLLKLVYVRYGTSLSNRRMFSNNFLLLACTTTLVITVVKSSLALSLGLVGALSIVRFRSAIKEPEELAYLFLTIAIGLGFGAGQTTLTVVSFAVIVSMVVLRNVWKKTPNFENLHLTVTSNGSLETPLSRIVETLQTCCSTADLRRFDKQATGLEASFLVEFDDFTQLDEVQTKLQALNDSVEISFLDGRGLS